MTTKQSVSRARVGFDKQNELAARLVLADVQRYGGEQAGLVIWARMLQAKTAPTIVGRLFTATGRRAA